MEKAGQQVAVAGNSAVHHRRRKTTTAVISTPPQGGYAAGPLRSTTDLERARVEALCAAHPELERLGYEPLLQVAAGYLDDEDLETRGDLRASGVQIGWHRMESDDVNPTWSDEQQ